MAVGSFSFHQLAVNIFAKMTFNYENRMRDSKIERRLKWRLFNEGKVGLYQMTEQAMRYLKMEPYHGVLKAGRSRKTNNENDLLLVFQQIQFGKFNRNTFETTDEEKLFGFPLFYEQGKTQKSRKKYYKCGEIDCLVVLHSDDYKHFLDHIVESHFEKITLDFQTCMSYADTTYDNLVEMYTGLEINTPKITQLRKIASSRADNSIKNKSFSYFRILHERTKRSCYLCSFCKMVSPSEDDLLEHFKARHLMLFELPVKASTFRWILSDL